MRSLSNLYKQRYIVTNQNNARVINSNEMLAARMEELAKSAHKKEGFIEGLNPLQVELEPEEPELSMEEIRQEAERIMKDAEEQARQLIDEANQQVEAITEAAKADGERKGYEAGHQRAAEELEEKRKRLEERHRGLEEEYQRMRDSLEPQIIDAVSDVFEKVFHVQFDQYKEILLHLVKNAILKIESTKEFQVRVNEKNYQYLESHKNEILSQVGQNITLEIEADASMDETQCVIETDSGFFDCSIDVQLENLIKAIRSLSV